MRGDRLSRCEQCVHYIRSGTAFLMSHLGLVAIVVGYTFMGGFAFEAIEKPNEQNTRNSIMEIRANVVDTLWVMTKDIDRQRVLAENNWTKEAETALKEFERVVIEAMKTEGYDGLDEGQLQWSFPGALFFSIIVITTIGYGNIAPKTKTGKLLTILYAIIGIPLLLLCLSSIGDIMANSFKFLYWKVCCYLCVQPKKRHKIRRHRISSEKGQDDEIEKNPPGSPLVDNLNKTHYFNDKLVQDYRPYGNSVSISPTSTFSSPKSSKGQTKYDSLSITTDVSNVPIISNKYVLQTDSDIQIPSVVNIPSSKSQPSSELSKAESDQESWSRREDHTLSEEDSDSDVTENEADEITVPVFLCVAVVIAYIIGGGVLFTEWEGWAFEDSCYFCFVTLTTIGFGDMVPGDAVMSKDNHLSLIACSLYLLFGMALIAMSFNLVQEKVTKSLKQVGKRIGILSSDDDDDN